MGRGAAQRRALPIAEFTQNYNEQRLIYRNECEVISHVPYYLDVNGKRTRVTFARLAPLTTLVLFPDDAAHCSVFMLPGKLTWCGCGSTTCSVRALQEAINNFTSEENLVFNQRLEEAGRQTKRRGYATHTYWESESEGGFIVARLRLDATTILYGVVNDLPSDFGLTTGRVTNQICSRCNRVCALARVVFHRAGQMQHVRDLLVEENAKIVSAETEYSCVKIRTPGQKRRGFLSGVYIDTSQGVRTWLGWPEEHIADEPFDPQGTSCAFCSKRPCVHDTLWKAMGQASVSA